MGHDRDSDVPSLEAGGGVVNLHSSTLNPVLPKAESPFGGRLKPGQADFHRETPLVNLNELGEQQI